MPFGLRVLGTLLILATLIGPAAGAVETAQAAHATPAPANAATSLAGLLGLAPALAADAYVPAIQLAAYADVAGQFAAVGVPRPIRFAVDDEATLRSIGVLSTLALPNEFRQHPDDDNWLPYVGFTPAQVDQVLQLGSLTGSLTFLRGHFDPDQVRATLTRNGYQEVTEDGVTAWTIGPDGDLTTGAGVQFGANGLNNVAFLPDGTVVAASGLDGLRATFAVQAGAAPSLADDAAVAALLAVVPPDLVSATILPSGLLARENTLGAGGTPLAVAGPSLPPVRLALLGITPGGPIRDYARSAAATPGATPASIPGTVAARLVIAAVFADPEAAAVAAPILAARLEQPSGIAPALSYADLFGRPVVTTPAGGSTVLIEAEFGELRPGGWPVLLFTGDLAFLYWDA